MRRHEGVDVARDEQQNDTVNTWTRTASLLISEAGNNETAASRQALRRMFGPWEQQLLEAHDQPQNPPRPLATLLSLRQLLTRFYQFRYEFDRASPPPNKLPVTVPSDPDFSTLRPDDGDFCLQILAHLPQQWLLAARKKFIVQEGHCLELEALLQRYFDRDAVHAAISAQSDGLRAIAENLGQDSAVKAFQNDSLRKTLAPLAANRSLDAQSFRAMLQQHRKNYDHLTIDGAGERFAVEGCSFRHTHFRNIVLELEGCALHHARFLDNSSIRHAHYCEFGKEAAHLQIDALRGDYSATHFDHALIRIVYPGSQLGHLSNCQVTELGGNVKVLQGCRVQTLRGLCLKVDNCLIERALRARFGPKLSGMRCTEMVDCQFGQQVVKGIQAVSKLVGQSYSDLTFVGTTIETVSGNCTLFRLRDCVIKHLGGTIAAVEQCRIGEIGDGATLNKLIASQVGLVSGGLVKLCGAFRDGNLPADTNPASDPAVEKTTIKRMTGGTIEQLNGSIEQLVDGDILHLGNQPELRLNNIKAQIGDWVGGRIGSMDKPEFLKKEKALLLERTARIGKAIRERAARQRAAR